MGNQLIADQHSHIPILVHRLDLEKLMQAIEPNDVELTGTLDGSFPMSVQDGLPAIQGGKLHSRYPGGVLRYRRDQPSTEMSKLPVKIAC